MLANDERSDRGRRILSSGFVGAFGENHRLHWKTAIVCEDERVDALVIVPGLNRVVRKPALAVEMAGRVAAARVKGDEVPAAVALTEAVREGTRNFGVFGGLQVEAVHPDQVGDISVALPKPAAVVAAFASLNSLCCFTKFPELPPHDNPPVIDRVASVNAMLG